MFERRLKILLCLPVFASAMILTRLFQLQVLRGDEYAQKIESAILAPPQDLPALRGRIMDRAGTVLASDEPAQDVTVHYGALSMDPAYLRLLAERLRRQEMDWRRTSEGDRVAEATRRIGRMWLTLEKASGVPLAELRRRRDAICQSIEDLRRHLWAARQRGGRDDPIDKIRLREEDQFHALIRDITPETRTRIEVDIGGLPFVRIEPSVRRVWRDDADAMCHVLGQMGTVSTAAVENDPDREDPLKAYRADDPAGLSGVERLAEKLLRGRRGYESRFLDGRTRDRVLPVDGLDIQLTIDLDLQQRIARILEEAVAQLPNSTGASCAVIAVDSREILALVSVPTFERSALRSGYAALRDDTRRMPLRFRAVSEIYQPGSILKPVALLAGFAGGAADAGQRIACSGALSPDSNSWHCWTHWRKLPGHGELNAEEALQHSCNIYFYQLGQRLGADRLTAFYRKFLGGSDDAAAFSAACGTGLIEESGGLIPSFAWLQANRRRGFCVADARNYAIGQGELLISPLQAANLFATLAAGRHLEPTLIANDGRERATREFPDIRPEAWSVVRRGLYRCVNEEGGTAFKYAHMDEIRICGKTGSAQCVPRVTERRFSFESPRGGVVSIVAATQEQALEELGLPPGTKCIGRRITRTWPPVDPLSGEVPTHAWFAGFAPYESPKIALAVLIEYGGGGGSAAGPPAKAIFHALLDSPRGYLLPSPPAGLARANAPVELAAEDP